MLILYRLGKNLTVTASMDGPVYTYEYKRSWVGVPNEFFPSSATHVTFSNSLEELEKLYEKEKKIN
jgi:hypothetical protein